MRTSWPSPAHKPLEGDSVSLQPLDLARDVEALWAISHGAPEKEAIWKYLPYGPFENSAAMKTRMQTEFVDSSDPLLWTVFERGSQSQVGTVGLLNIVPAHGRAEIGHVWFSPRVHKTGVNTQTQFVLLNYLFDELKYRRVEWKCDSLNHASRTTASRMGFVFEGRFRQHMVNRGRNRDTDYFAMTDKDWPRCKANFQTWLDSSGAVSLGELNLG